MLEEEVAERRYLLVAQAAGRLVEQQQARLGDERASQLDSLQRRVREARGAVPCQAAEVDELQHRQRTLPAVGLPEPVRPRMRADEDVLQHRHLREERDVLERACDALADDVVRSDLQQVLPVVEDLRRNPACRVA